jgi:integrase
MALYQRGRVWYADFYANGERVQESTGKTNRREAEKHLALRISEIERHVFVKPVRILLSEFGERYIAHAKTHKRSWKRDVQMLGHLQGFFGEVDLADIGPMRIEEYQAHRLDAVRPATVNRELALLKHMFNLAERWDLYKGQNSVRRVRFLAEDNLQFHILQEDDQRKLLACAPPYLREMILFALNTGLRSGEIFNLTWQEVDLDRRTITPIVRKTRRPLELPLNDTAHAILVSRGAAQHGPFVFYNPETGTRFKDVKLGLQAAVRRAGIKKITWHTFRHTFASRLTQTGVDLVTVKELLGHSTINVTMRYAHSNLDAKARAVARLRSSDKIVTIVPRTRKRAKIL